MRKACVLNKHTGGKERKGSGLV